MKRELWKKLTSATLSVVLALGLCPALAFAGTADLQVGEGAFVGTQEDTIADGTYKLENIKSSTGMLGFDAASFVVNGDNAWLVVKCKTSEKTPAYRFADFALGKYGDVVVNGDLKAGTPKASVVYDSLVEVDGKQLPSAVTFTVPIAKSIIEKKEPIDFIVRYRDGYSDDHDGDWYKPKNDFQLLSSVAGSPYSWVSAEAIDVSAGATLVELSVSNEELMWPVVKATIEDYPGGQDYLVVFANGESYDWFFAGSQAEAVATFSGKEQDARWAHYLTTAITSTYKNSKGVNVKVDNKQKRGYRLPVTLDGNNLNVPIVAYATDYSARRAEVDIAKKTAIFGNDMGTVDMSISSTVNDVAVDSKGSLKYKGYLRPYATADKVTETSNKWNSTLSLKLTNSIYDKAYTAPAVVSEAQDAVSVGSNGSLVLPITNVYKGTTQFNGTSATVKMHVADNAAYSEAGTWVDRTMTFDFKNSKVTISGQALTAKKEETKKTETTTTTTPTTTPTTTTTTTATSTDKPAADGIAKGESATAGSGAAAAKVEATSATEVAYVAPKSKSTKKVVVPDAVEVNGKPYKVTSVAANALKGSKATSITIGNNVTTLGKGALANTKKLTKLTLGKNLKKVGKGALKGSKVTKVTLKSSKLAESSMKNLLKGSKVKTVKLKGVPKKVKKDYKKWAKAYNVTVK